VRLFGEGLGAEAGRSASLAYAQAAGSVATPLAVDGNNKSDEELEAAAKPAACTLDAPDDVERAASAGWGAR
jgi:hypothetical protein